MVVIRLSRGGTKKRPFYHVAVSNSREARDGRFIERVGFYNPIAAGEEVKLQLNQERIDYWLSKGAKPSEKVQYLIDNFADIASGTEKKKPKPKKEPKPESVGAQNLEPEKEPAEMPEKEKAEEKPAPEKEPEKQPEPKKAPKPESVETQNLEPEEKPEPEKEEKTE